MTKWNVRIATWSEFKKRLRCKMLRSGYFLGFARSDSCCSLDPLPPENSVLFDSLERRLDWRSGHVSDVSRKSVYPICKGWQGDKEINIILIFLWHIVTPIDHCEPDMIYAAIALSFHIPFFILSCSLQSQFCAVKPPVMCLRRSSCASLGNWLPLII